MQEFAGQSSAAGSATKEGSAGLQTLSGVEHLETGDILIRTAGIVTLVTPSGDRIVIDAEGKLSIEGKVVGADRNKEGVNSICFKDNAIVKVDKQGLLEIHRNGHILKFPRREAESAVSEPAKEAVQPAAAEQIAVEPKAAVRLQERKELPVQAAPRAAEPVKNNAAPVQGKKWSVPSYELPGLDIAL